MTIDEFMRFMVTHSVVEVDAYLVANPMDLDQGRADGEFTPLTYAIDRGDPALVKVLLDHGADPNFYAENDFPALSSAIEDSWEQWDYVLPYVGVPSLETILYLTDRGADWHLPDRKDGTTPQQMAVSYGHLQALALFSRLEWERGVAGGAPVDVEGLIYLDRIQEARDLVEAEHPDLNQPGSSGRTPLETAIEKRNPDLVRFLVEHGADLEFVDSEYYTPLGMAVRFAVEYWDYVEHRQGEMSTSMVELLIGLGASVVAPEELRLTFGADNPDAVDMTYVKFASFWNHEPARELFARLSAGVS